jgi:mannose-1-phosphate guanylyltransferase
MQYCTTGKSRPLIQRSIHRALSITKSRRVIATLAEAHRQWWSTPLWCIAPRRRVVDESAGRPTVTLAAAVAIVERAAPDALLVIQPADAFRAGDAAFVAGVRRAIGALDKLPGHVVTLAIETHSAEPGQDYLLLGAADGLPARPALSFVKRPQALVAERLVEIGACVSTGVYIARLSALTNLLAERWPDLMAAARSLVAGPSPQSRADCAREEEVVMPVRMAGTHFSRPWRHTWVQRPLPRLRVVPVDDCGWSSVGEVSADEELTADYSCD